MRLPTLVCRLSHLWLANESERWCARCGRHERKVYRSVGVHMGHLAALEWEWKAVD